MTEALKNAEQALHSLEKHKHAAANHHIKANKAARRALEDSDEPEEVKKHELDVKHHIAQRDRFAKAHAESGVTDRQLDEAAQKVLDARGEKHTETNILPPGVASDAVEK